MSLFDEIFVPSEEQSTQRALQRYLTPMAMARLIAVLRSSPAGTLNVGYGQSPTTLDEARPLLHGDRMNTLLSLLAQRH